MRLLFIFTLVIIIVLSFSCTDEEEEVIVVTSSDVRERFNMLVSVFENDTPLLPYDAIENLNDGRGFTCGWMGLVTSEAEVADFVKAYTLARPGNGLSVFQNELNSLAQSGSDNTSGLPDFPAIWKTESSNTGFRDLYDKAVDDIYFKPAMSYLQDLGFSLNLTKFILFDAIIQHGDGDDPDGLNAMITRTNALISTNDEKLWCSKFLDVRYETLTNPDNTSTQEVWQQSRPRVTEQRDLISAGNWDVNGPIEIDNGYYTHCIIE